MRRELPTHLVHTLTALDYVGSHGLLTIADAPEVGSRDYQWRDLRDKVGLDAVFFNDGVPIVGFSSVDDMAGLAGVRKRLWNYGRVPLLVNSSAERVTAFDAASTVPRDGADAMTGCLHESRVSAISSQLLRVFNRHRVESGSFDFGHRQSNRSRRVNRVDSVLLRNLSELKQRTLIDSPGSKDDFETLVGGCLIASYLRDRGILTADHLVELSNHDDLDAVLMSGTESASHLFRGLADRFNGDVFGAVPASLSRIRNEDLAGIAGMLRGDDLASGQLALWPYDFSVLPADLVSSVYEELLADTRRADSAYYTPRFLVDLVLDEILPWNRDGDVSRHPVIADIACGSGAFMIEAFRRIAYLEQGRVEQRLTYSDLNELLIEHIYGVDQNPAAARVAAFGLYLAVLEMVEPPDIWETVRLPQLLGQNIIVDDAFGDHVLRKKSFDVVVSNPPWASRLSTYAAKYIDDNSLPVADRQISQAFIWLAHELLRPGGILGLVLPSKPVLHNRGPRANSFREALFRNLDVKTIVDLSPIRRSIFSAAIAPSVVLVACKPDSASPERPPEEEILHLAARPHLGGNPIDALVIGPEDIHMIPASVAGYRSDIWKVLLWGCQRDLEFIDRLRRRYPSASDIRAKHQWTASQGFQVGGGDRNDASEIFGLPIIETDSIGYLRLNAEPTESAEWQSLHRPRNRSLYSAPLVIVSRTIRNGGLAAVTLENDSVFPNGCVGISAPMADRGVLEFFAAATVSSLGQYWHFMTSASWGVERDFVELNEILSLPLPEPSTAQLQRLRQITRKIARNGASSELRLSVDDLVYEVYGLSSADRARIDDRMVTAVGRFYNRRPEIPAGLAVVESYQATLLSALRTTLPSIDARIRTSEEGNYRIVSVTLKSRDSGPMGSHQATQVDMSALLLQLLAYGENAATAVVAQPSGFFVDEDTIYILKTNDIYRWTTDSALDDADKIIASITTAA